MKIHFKSLLLLCVIALFAFTGIHKYYISVTQIDYIKDKESIQIISRIFIDDFENLLRERYDETITLTDDKELEIVNSYIERYLKEKINVLINNKEVDLVFIGKEYDGDIMRCYMEISKVRKISSFEVVNKVLFDLYEEQQNLVKLKINSKQKSFILTSQNDKALLAFI